MKAFRTTLNRRRSPLLEAPQQNHSLANFEMLENTRSVTVIRSLAV